MPWFQLVLAGLLEVAWAVGLKRSEGFTKLGPSVFTVIAMILSFVLLARAMRTLPMGTAYAVWTGIGAVGTACVGLLWLGEPRTAGRLVCLGLIVAGIAGLKLLTPDTP
jgi:quaternary ammonium compound-resistance protein SugE